jgi:hypothetical protein
MTNQPLISVPAVAKDDLQHRGGLRLASLVFLASFVALLFAACSKEKTETAVGEGGHG